MCDTNINCNCKNCLKLGEKAPDFTAITTHGKIKFSDYIKGSWAILFSYPADFTPVCTTEFVAFSEKKEEFDKRGVKIIGLSVDSVYSHIAWLRTIEEYFEIKIEFPVIADLSTDVAKKYGMIHDKINSTQTVRVVIIINSEGEIVFMITHPISVGRNIDELIRIIDALQLVDTEKIDTPANWKKGESAIMPPPETIEDAKKRIKEEKNNPECCDWFLCKIKI